MDGDGDGSVESQSEFRKENSIPIGTWLAKSLNDLQHYKDIRVHAWTGVHMEARDTKWEGFAITWKHCLPHRPLGLEVIMMIVLLLLLFRLLVLDQKMVGHAAKWNNVWRRSSYPLSGRQDFSMWKGMSSDIPGFMEILIDFVETVFVKQGHFHI